MFSDHLVKHSIPGLLTFSVIKVNQIFPPTQRWLTHVLQSLGVFKEMELRDKSGKLL